MAWLRQGSRLEAWVIPAGGVVLHLVLRLLGLTTKKRFVGFDPLTDRFAANQRVILSFWHGRMVMMPFAYGGRGACIMNSQHRDGELISRAIQPFGISVVRGSSTRGWAQGLRGLLRAFREGKDLVMVPDGPRGPRCQAKTGPLQLARTTGAPIYPVSCGFSRAWRLRSWDRLEIPKPFSRVVFVAEAPIEVPRDATTEQLEELRALLQGRLNVATLRADREVGIASRITAEYIGEESAAALGPAKD